MMVLAISFFLWAVVVVLALLAWRRGPETFKTGIREGVLEFIYLIPRLAIGVIGSGFLAALVPGDLVRSWLGPDSGPIGLGLATLAGALTPGGPVVGFAIGATALKSGAGLPAVVAYSTAWALFAIQRLFVWELPVMSVRIVLIRCVASLPLPFLAAWAFMLLPR